MGSSPIIPTNFLSRKGWGSRLNSSVKEHILLLREQGLSYNAICAELGCSKGTVAYYCGENQKEKTNNRRKIHRAGLTSPKEVISRFCLSCGKPTKNEKYCDNACQQQDYYDNYIKNWKKGVESGANESGTKVSKHIRRYLFEKHDSKCSRCGWNTKNPYTNSVILEVEHIDGNSLNNKEENLDLICPNCHSLTPTYKALNYGKGNRARLQHYKLI